MEQHRKSSPFASFFSNVGQRENKESPLALRHLGNHLQPNSNSKGFSCIGISGFTSKGSNLINVWKPLCDVFPDANSYALEWESGSTLELSLYLGTAFFNRKILSFLPNEAKLQRIPGSNSNSLGSIVNKAIDKAEVGYGVATNSLRKFSESWERAQKDAHTAGEELARQISTSSLGKQPLILIGIDLGTEVILATLKSLGQARYTGIIRSVVLLGSTAPHNSSLLSESFKAVQVGGHIINGFSGNDIYLSYLNRQSKSDNLLLGLGQGSLGNEFSGVKEIDLKEEIGIDHLRYSRELSSILRRVRNEFTI